MVRHLWRLLPAGFRASIRGWVESLIAFASWACLWRWRLALMPAKHGGTVFLGRERCAGEAAALLDLGAVARTGARAALGALRSGRSAVVSEAYVPGALRVPRQVRVVFPTHSGRMRLSSRRRALASEHRVRQAAGDAEVEHVHQEFLVPFALNRHGTGAAQLTLSTVRGLAEHGRLDILLHGNDPVGAHLGFASVQGGKRYWVGCRVGYPRQVYEDSRRLADHNAINFFLQFRHAEDAGFDFYDMGESLARPEGGLLQFKKRMGGVVATCARHNCFWVRPPQGEAPQMLWDAPLFGLERRGLVLNVGLPDGLREGEAVERYRDLAFDGLAAVRLHATTQVSTGTLDELKRHFRDTPVEVTLGPGPRSHPGR